MLPRPRQLDHHGRPWAGASWCSSPLTSAGCNLETWGWDISCSPSPWSSPPPRCTVGVPCSTGGEGEPMARAGRGKRLFDVMTKNYTLYWSFSVHGRIILACMKCAKSEQIQEDYFSWRTWCFGWYTGCFSWCTWRLWNWDGVSVTFGIWDLHIWYFHCKKIVEFVWSSSE